MLDILLKPLALANMLLLTLDQVGIAGTGVCPFSLATNHLQPSATSSNPNLSSRSFGTEYS